MLNSTMYFYLPCIYLIFTVKKSLVYSGAKYLKSVINGILLNCFFVADGQLTLSDIVKSVAQCTLV